MSDLLRKTYLLGLGLASLTREKVEEVVDDLVKKGEVAEKDRKQVMSDILERAREEQQKLTETIKDSVHKVVGEMRVPSRTQYEALLQKIEELEARLREFEKPGEDVSTPQDA